MPLKLLGLKCYQCGKTIHRKMAERYLLRVKKWEAGGRDGVEPRVHCSRECGGKTTRERNLQRKG